MKVSLNIATFNWKNALHLVLESIRAQTMLPHEVVITDDGSTKDTQALIEQHQQTFPCPLVHLWQEDKGFRLARARNMGIAHSTGDYIVQIDGDMLLHGSFIEDHVTFARAGFFSQGGRVILPKQLTARLLEEPFRLPSLYEADIGNRKNGFRLPRLTQAIRNNTRNTLIRLRGCNQAFFRDDLIKVNGYNEEFTGWGSEDYELVARLMKTGIRKQNLKFAAIAYHLYHKEADKEKMQQNIEIYERIKEGDSIHCAQGIHSHLLELEDQVNREAVHTQSV